MSDSIKIDLRPKQKVVDIKYDHKFVFENGDEVPFNKFKVIRHEYLQCGQPAKIPGKFTSTVSVYVTKEVFDYERKERYERRAADGIGAKTQVGVLSYRADVGIPSGAYVPLRWNNATRRFDVYLIGLTNDKLILDEEIADTSVIAEVNGKKKVDGEAGEDT